MKAYDKSRDKNIRRALYPTWFRWKLTMANPQREDGYTFISHMVQMKAQASVFQPPARVTLYPTWFRWKNEKQKEHDE